MGSPGSAGASGDTRTVEAPCPGAPASTTTCGPGDMPAVVKVAVAPVTSGWWSTSVAVAATCSWYVTPASSVAPGRTTKRLASRELRTTRVPGTGGFNVIAASVAAMFMAVEKLTEIEASTATPVDPSAGTSARITGAGPVGDRPVVVDGVQHAARISDPGSEGECVRGARREDRARVEQREAGVAGEPDNPAWGKRTRAERGHQVARGDRPVHREASPDGGRHDRPVELDRHRSVGGHTHSSARWGQLNDLWGAAETPGQRSADQSTGGPGCDPAQAGGEPESPERPSRRG